MDNKTSDPVRSKLFAADAELEAQEAQLNAQLAEIQAKRASLKTVLAIFDADQTATTASTVEIAPSQSAAGEIDATKEKPVKATAKKRAKPITDKLAQPRKSTRKAQAKRRGWQKYMRDEHGQTPLPDVVSGILKAQPKKVFEIAEVINTIVVEDIPHKERKNARNRISNILAEGARKNLWLRPKAGGYRFAK